MFFISKLRNGGQKMSNDIRIRIKDFYKDAVGESEYVYVSKEVYEALSDTFRKEAHAQCEICGIW